MNFRGPYAFLSNMYPCTLNYEGVEYTCSETAFQAQKLKIAIPDLDLESFAKYSGLEAKRRSRDVRLRKDQREVWDNNKVSVMYCILVQKFVQNEDLSNQLLFTGDIELIEDNTWGDRFWGRDQTGEGLNMLGEVLMKIRAEIRKDTDEDNS